MAVAAISTDGVALVALLGLGHSAAYLVGAAVLGVIVHRRVARPLWPAALGRVVAVSTVAGALAYAATRAVDADSSRVADLAVVLGATVLGAIVVLIGYRLLGVAERAHRPCRADRGSSMSGRRWGGVLVGMSGGRRRRVRRRLDG